jgi:SPP1 family predicted phage head-tail adaptor
MTIRAGLLNRLVRFERRQSVPDAFNEDVGEWVEFARAYAQFVSLNAREFFAALQAQSDTSSRVVVRYTPQLAAVRTTDRIVTANRVYDIQAVINPDGRTRELHFLVTEHDEAQP